MKVLLSNSLTCRVRVVGRGVKQQKGQKEFWYLLGFFSGKKLMFIHKKLTRETANGFSDVP